MRISDKKRINVAGVVASIVLLSGCAINMPVPIKDPSPSSQSYQLTGSPAPLALSFTDAQTETDKTKLLTGRIPMQLLYQSKPFDAVPWLAQQTVKEMVARGLPVALATDNASGSLVQIKRLHIENHRVSGFSPFVTLTSLRADLASERGPQRITAYIKRGKVPVWSFDEVIDPTYNDPLGLLTKELAAKLNQLLFGQRLGDDQVQALIDKVRRDGDQGDAYLDVYQLGFSNNQLAVPELVKLCGHSSEYVRLAAISSLGILKASDRFDFLRSIYDAKDGLWQDRAMALKAIGDLGTPASQDYLRAEWLKLLERKDLEAQWNKEIILLYLDQDQLAPEKPAQSKTGA